MFQISWIAWAVFVLSLCLGLCFSILMSTLLLLCNYYCKYFIPAAIHEKQGRESTTFVNQAKKARLKIREMEQLSNYR